MRNIGCFNALHARWGRRIPVLLTEAALVEVVGELLLCALTEPREEIPRGAGAGCVSPLY